MNIWDWAAQLTVNGKGNYQVTLRGQYAEFDQEWQLVGGSPKATRSSCWFDRAWVDAAATFGRTQAAEQAVKAAKLSGKKVYVRFGKIPECGYSQNYRDGVAEAGVSCYEAVISQGRAIIDCVDAAFVMFNSDRPLYLISGDLVDQTGSDGEPLLTNAKIGKRIKSWELA